MTGQLRRFLAALLATLAAASGAGASVIEAVHLTWWDDPTTTMVVRWLSLGESPSTVAFAPPEADGDWLDASGEARPVPGSNRLLHSVELRDLAPGGRYRFRVAGYDGVFAFRTMPADASQPIRFIVGGDVYRERLDERIYREAARLDPMFVVIGGDIVYDNGMPGNAARWLYWLKAWNRLMVTDDGRLIPLLAAIGNHEAAGQFGATPDDAPFYYTFFSRTPGEPQGYRALDFGGYMSIILLDSGHTHAVAGAQTDWLAEALGARAGVDHLFAVYHVPAYPSVRDFDEPVSLQIREHWVPLFEANGVDAAFEHHDHAYKRTPPLNGVVYLGDGAWGAKPRAVHPAGRTWYLARSESVNNFILTTIRGPRCEHRAVSKGGSVIDSYDAGAGD